MADQDIVYWNREKKREETEKVYGQKLLQWAYQSLEGKTLKKHFLSFLSKPTLSRLYGYYQSSPLSRFKINRFIHDFNIPMEDYEEKKFSSFNDFFIRKFRDQKRTFSKKESDFCAPAEGRYLFFDTISPTQTFPVKGHYLTASELLGDEKKAQPFTKGPLMIARLCPVDYHRFHFPDEGDIIESYTISGDLHSVNPIALKAKGNIFIKNERHVTLMKTKNFGTIAYIEVGAMMVGKIVQTFSKSHFLKGEEKGYFLFGGSTVIILGEPHRFKMSKDLLEKTKKNQECFIKLGDVIASG